MGGVGVSELQCWLLLFAGGGGVHAVSMLKATKRGRCCVYLVAMLASKNIAAEPLPPCSAITVLIRGGGYSKGS